MKRMSLPEFRDYCEGFTFSTIIFATENQSWRSVDDTLSVGLQFNTMMIFFNPNTIHLKDGHNGLSLSKVKAVECNNEEKCLLGAVFTVICGDVTGNSDDKKYTLIAR